MKYQLKLNCPMCNKEFTTPRRDKIWCDKRCSIKYRDIKKSIETNNKRQLQIEDDRYTYDADSNTWFITSFLTEESYKRFPNLGK